MKQVFTLKVEGKIFCVGNDGRGLYTRKNKSGLYEMVKSKANFSIVGVEEEAREAKVRKAALEYLKSIDETM